MGDIMVRFISGVCIGIEFYGKAEFPYIKWAVGIDLLIIRLVFTVYDDDEISRAVEAFKKMKKD